MKIVLWYVIKDGENYEYMNTSDIIKELCNKKY